MSESTDTTPGKETVRHYSKQNQIIQAYITDSEIFLNTASQDTAIRAILETCGYDEAEFATGYELVSRAQATFEQRAKGMGTKAAGTLELAAENKAVRGDYARFRQIARAAFPERPDRIALSVTGDVPDDTGKFITLANASYTAAAKPPHTEKLTKRGYPVATLQTLLAGLRQLAGETSDHEEEKGDAIGSTDTRNQTYEDLRDYMRELKGTAKGALRGMPALLAKLEF